MIYPRIAIPPSSHEFNDKFGRIFNGYDDDEYREAKTDFIKAIVPTIVVYGIEGDETHRIIVQARGSTYRPTPTIWYFCSCETFFRNGSCEHYDHTNEAREAIDHDYA